MGVWNTVFIVFAYDFYRILGKKINDVRQLKQTAKNIVLIGYVAYS